MGEVAAARAAAGAGDPEDPPRRPADAAERVTLLVDMDGVLCDFDRAVNEHYAARHPSEPLLPLADRSFFYMRKNYGERFGPHAAERVKRITESEGFFENLPPIPGAIDAMRQLDAHPDLHVVICTAPLTQYRFVLREKYAWIEKHLGPSWTQRIVLTKDKTLVCGAILVDDRPEVTGMLHPPPWTHVLFDQPYNRHLGKPRLRAWDASGVDQLLGMLLGSRHIARQPRLGIASANFLEASRDEAKLARAEAQARRA